MNIIDYWAANASLIASRTVEHLSIVLVAVGLAIVTGVPIGIAISRRTGARRTACSMSPRSSITIPSIALFGMMIPILIADRPGHRLSAGGDRGAAVFAASHHPQHLHRDHQCRPGACARRRAAWGMTRSSGSARGGNPIAAAGDHGGRAHRGGDEYRGDGDRRLYRRRRPRRASSRAASARPIRASS